MSRRLAVLLIACLALPALALAADGDPKRQINPADQRKAASVVLKRSDFAAGWKKVPSTAGKDDTSCPGYDPDQSDLVLTGDVEADFKLSDGITSVSSVANVYKTRREAVTAWSRSAKPALAPCLAQLLEKEIEKGGAKATITKSGVIAFPKLAPRTIAYRVSLNATFTEAGKTATVPLTMHIVVLGNGRGDCGLITVALGNGIPIPELRAFGKLTAARLAAAKL